LAGSGSRTADAFSRCALRRPNEAGGGDTRFVCFAGGTGSIFAIPNQDRLA
jgi:hypothetical protein